MHNCAYPANIFGFLEIPQHQPSTKRIKFMYKTRTTNTWGSGSTRAVVQSTAWALHTSPDQDVRDVLLKHVCHQRQHEALCCRACNFFEVITKKQQHGLPSSTTGEDYNRWRVAIFRKTREGVQEWWQNISYAKSASSCKLATLIWCWCCDAPS
jgi:hypothetical protein